MPTMSVTLAYSIGSGGKQLTVSKTSGAETQISETIADGTTNGLVAFTLDVSKALAVYISASADMTLKTNSSGSPDQTFALAAGVPLVWCEDMPTANPLTTDITALYATNASGDDGVLTVAVLVDPT
jgi:hypothetical protein